ncbi:tRNA dihydrouridine synthase DusB [bacterium]|nr:tRNA dihydrouridine synthase DusB [bacterium]MBU1984191.1 tRNA dihydrouridine synthase DusB [bacterium]
MNAATSHASPAKSALDAATDVRLGPLRLSSPAVLAPLAGYTDTAMRRICRRFGAGMVFSEMLSAEGARRDNAKTFKMAAFTPEERPYSIQLFSTNPEQAADAARILAELGPDALDLNFGCPVKKIALNSGGGAALLKDIPLLARIVEATVKAVDLPVSVKMRSGWDRRSLNAVDVAHAVADAGASWVTVHARTRSDLYKGQAQWEWIAEVKAAVSIPVIGNGDVRTAPDAIRLMEVTSCDAVMIGRAAIGNPFIFREVNHLLRHGRESAPATPLERFDAAATQLRWAVEQWGEAKAVREFRKHLLAYVRGLPHSSAFKTEAMKLERADDVIEALHGYFSSLPDDAAPHAALSAFGY